MVYVVDQRWLPVVHVVGAARSPTSLPAFGGNENRTVEGNEMSGFTEQRRYALLQDIRNCRLHLSPDVQ